MDEIGRENMKKLKSMSKKEVMQEIEELKSTLNPKLLEKLRKIGAQK